MPADVSTALPQLDLRDSTIVTVTLDDPGAVITQLVLHAYQTLPSVLPDNPVPRLALEPDIGGPGGT
jgi:hypothetical protein